MGIPFMGDFSIQVVDDVDENGTPNVCFKSAISSLFINSMALSALLVSALIY